MMADPFGQATLAAEDRVAAAFGAALSQQEEAPPADEQRTEAPADEGKAAELPKHEKSEHDPAKAGEKEGTKPAEEVESIEIDPEEELFETEFETPEGKAKRKLSLKELQLGYMRTQDYTRKTQDVARQRDEVQVQVRQGTEQAAKAYVERLEAFQKALVQSVAPELAQADWNRLAAEDPSEYVRLSNRANQLKATWETMQRDIEGAKTKLREEEEKTRMESARKSVDALSKAIPGWGDDKYRQVLSGAVEKYGWDMKDIANVVDHKIIQMAHDALEYQRLKDSKPVIEKKVALVPKVVKPGTTQRATGDSGSAALERLKKSHRDEDLQAFFTARVK